MKKIMVKYFALAALLASAFSAYAYDELAIYAFKDGQAARGLTVMLNGAEEQTIGKDGSAYFDLSGGANSIQLLDNGVQVHSFRFDAGQGQLVDINVTLAEGAEPKVAVESYFRTETAADRLRAPKGVLQGYVSSLGVPIAGADIVIDSANLSTVTESNGYYEIELPRGIYQLEISHPEFGSKDISNLRVVANVVKGSNFTISQESQSLEEVVVLGTYRAGGLELNERDSSNVVDTIGIEQLARFGDSDVAGSVVRVPSVTVQDSRFIFIRGLGGRYITTTLNQSTMPSTDPSKRTVPLDLFPSNIVSQLDVKKTFIASMPGESTGGNLVINTRTFPDERSGKLFINAGTISGLTGSDAFVDPSSGDWDLIGWDDGTREEPIAVTAIAQALSVSEFYPDSVERELGRIGALLLKDDFDLDTKTASPNISFGANYGDVYYIGDSEIGVFAAGNYKNAWSQKDEGIRRTYESNGQDISDDFTFEEQANEIDISGLLSIGANIGNNTFQANTIVSRATQSKVFRAVGFDGDALEESVRHSIEWVERQFIAQQFAGEHFLNESGTFALNWQVTASQATRNSPDRREVRFDLSGGDDVFNLEVPNLLRRYDELVDNNIDVSGDFKYDFESGLNMQASLSFGFQVISRERDSDSASYGFTGGQTAIDDNSPNLLVSEVLNQDSITGDTDTGYTFINKTLPSDSYDAEMDLNSLYVSYDNLFLDRYQIIVGARYEDYQQETDTFSLQGAQGPVVSSIDDAVVLPTLGFNWFYSDTQQLRLAVYQTVSRPDFKETSNATFYDTEFDFRVRGNPNLQTSEVTNYDARWEYYWSETESISVALFYKDLKDPIERVVQVASGTAGNSRTFENSDSAELYGIELDGRKDFALNSSLTRTIFVAMNASFIESEVQLVDSSTRKLQGQPDYTFNLVLGYDDLQSNQELTLLLNQSGESIKDVGISGQPDVIEEPRLDVKLNYKYFLTDNFVLKAKIDNLLNADVEFTQGGRVFQGYKKGIEFQVGLDWQF